MVRQSERFFDSFSEALNIMPQLSQQERINYITTLLNSQYTTRPSAISLSQCAQQYVHFPQDVQRDFALTIRARDIEQECTWLETLGETRNCFLFPESGVFVIPGPSTARPQFHGSVLQASDTRVIVSAPDWTSMQKALTDNDLGQSVVILPELITIAGELEIKDIAHPEKVQDVLHKNLHAMCEISRLFPNTTYVVGTPVFQHGYHRPFNAVVHIRNGNIHNVAYKYNGVRLEREFFSFPDNRDPQSVQDGSMLVCKDLLTLCNGLSHIPAEKSRKRHPKASADSRLFLSDDTRELFVASCWGIGAEGRILSSRNQQDIDKTYIRSLSITVARVFEGLPQLQQVIISDIVSPFSEPDQSQHPIGSKPMSMVGFPKLRYYD